MTSKEFQMLTR